MQGVVVDRLTGDEGAGSAIGSTLVLVLARAGVASGAGAGALWWAIVRVRLARPESQQPTPL